MVESRKTRLNPSKLLVLLLYGTYPYLDVEVLDKDTRRLTLEIGQFARLMRVKKQHVAEYLEWLEKMSFLTIADCSQNHISVVLSTPTVFQEIL